LRLSKNQSVLSEDNMKRRMLLISLVVIIGLACGISVEAIAQGAGGAGGFGAGGGRGAGGAGGFGAGGGRAGGGRGGVLTPEQTAKITEVTQTEMTALTQKLQEAQKAAVAAAVAPGATEISVGAKIKEVVRIQTEMAMLKFKGIKAIASTITDDQKTQLEGAANAYQTLFGAGRTMGGQRGGAGAGGAGGAGGGRRGGAGATGATRSGGTS
jgi:Spy/CpxP family protein refolding chaperone